VWGAVVVAVVVVAMVVVVAGTITEMGVDMDPIETRVVDRVHDHTENSKCYYYELSSVRNHFYSCPMDLYSHTGA
jgi:hypothetical protein